VTHDGARAAFDVEAARIRSLPPAEAFEAAGELVGRHSELRGLSARLRSEQARRVQESGDMGVTELARHLGVTKQRAHQILKRAGETAGDQPL